MYGETDGFYVHASDGDEYGGDDGGGGDNGGDGGGGYCSDDDKENTQRMQASHDHKLHPDVYSDMR